MCVLQTNHLSYTRALSKIKCSFPYTTQMHTVDNFIYFVKMWIKSCLQSSTHCLISAPCS